MKKHSFYSYLVTPVKCIDDFSKTGLATRITGYFPLVSDLPLVKNLRRKRVYLVPIRSYHEFPIAGIPSFLKNRGLQICKNAPNYLGGLPPQVKDHSREFDDLTIVALGYPDRVDFTPEREDIRHLSGPLGLMFRGLSDVNITIVSDIYTEFKNGKCIILAEKLHR